MKKVFLFCLLLVCSGALDLAAQTRKKEEAPAETYTIEGKVKRRFGVFAIISIDNWDDLDEFPLIPQEGYIYMYIDKDVPANLQPGWIKIAKAEVFKTDREEKHIEVKLLEDFGTKAASLGLGELKLVVGNMAQFRWEYKEQE
jgi:hypothetical protein